MLESLTELDYEFEDDYLLIGDLAPEGNVKAAQIPTPVLKGFLEGIINLCEQHSTINCIIVNTSCMTHIDALEQAGFTILEEDSEAHFVCAEYLI